jgi:hypothetical protein
MIAVLDTFAFVFLSVIGEYLPRQEPAVNQSSLRTFKDKLNFISTPGSYRAVNFGENRPGCFTMTSVLTQHFLVK